MAIAKMILQPQGRWRRARTRTQSLRLLRTQRAEEVFPVLLEEIVSLGYARALILETGPAGEIVPVTTLNWQEQEICKLPSSSLAGTIETRRPAMLSCADYSRPLYAHPLYFSGAGPCWEAGRAASDRCLAVAPVDKVALSTTPVCALCGMRGYASLAVVELHRHNSEGDLAALAELIEMGNLQFAHLLKAEHYYNRMRDKELTLAQMRAAVQRMNQPELDALRRAFPENKTDLERRMLEIEKFAAAGRLAATIAHEVNNPMEAIKNAVYLLADSIPEGAKPVYDILQSETDRVARVVRQMLGLYRDNEAIQAINVNTIIEDTLLLLGRQLQRASVMVECELAAVPEAPIAADQLRQVLSNMIINARDAMPEGGKLLFRTRHLQNPARVRISIADTGAGITQEIIGNIFEPFVTTKGEKGTGLGLWIVRGIVQNHAGSLRVKSRLGTGTIFWIDLPMSR